MRYLNAVDTVVVLGGGNRTWNEHSRAKLRFVEVAAGFGTRLMRSGEQQFCCVTHPLLTWPGASQGVLQIFYPDDWPGSYRSILIKPSADWFEDAWSPISAEVHNIPRQDLNAAPSVDVVARDFLTILGDRIALSDAPAFERHWLETLLEAAKLVNTVQIQDFDATTLQTFPDAALDHIYERMIRGRTKHRAGDDSAKLANAWAVGLRHLYKGENNL